MPPSLFSAPKPRRLICSAEGGLPRLSVPHPSWVIMPRAWLLSCLLVGCFCLLAPAAGGDGDAALQAIRQALANRKLPAAQAALEQARQVEGDAEYRATVERLDELTDYVGQFWEAYRLGLRRLAATDELEVGDTIIAVVEVTPERLVIRASGRNRRYPHSEVPSGIAVAVAGQVLDPQAADNLLIVGAFAAMDRESNREKARAAWQKAAAAGAEVAHLLPELAAAEPLPAIEIPPLDRVRRLMLAPEQWAQRRSAGDADLVDLSVGRQNAQGRLEINVPADQAALQVVTQRPLTGNFAVRVILEDVRAGQQFGLFASDAARPAAVVDLPTGTMIVEFARRGAVYRARIAGEEVEVRQLGEVPRRFSGRIGITAPPGSGFKISALEFAR